MRGRIFVQYTLSVFLLACLALFLILPVWLTIRGGFIDRDADQWTIQHILLIFSDPTLRSGLLNATLIACATTCCCLVISLPLALLNVKCNYPGKALWSAVILVPLILPPFVGAIGMRQLLGRYGALNSLLGDAGIDWLGTAKFWGVVIVEALHLYPIVYLNATAALANLDPTLEEAARNIGVSPLRRFWSIILPLIRPGLFAGCTIVFIWSFTELGTPLMFDYYEVTPVQIFSRIKEMENSAQPYALTAVMLFCAIMFYVLGKMVFGGRAYAMYSKASIASQTKRLSTLAGFGASGLFLVVTGLAVLPHIGVILTSFSENGQWYHSVLPSGWTTQHYEDALTHKLAMGSITNSLKYAVIAMLITLLAGVTIGYIVVRTRVIFRGLLDALSILPLAVPGLVMAFGYVALTLEPPFNWTAETAPDWGRWFLPIAGWFDVLGPTANPLVLLVVAYSVRRLPYMVRSTVAGLEQTSQELEEASRNLGAGPATTIRRVTLPLIMANLIAGGLLVFAFSMLEVSDSLILAQREIHFPFTKAIYTFFERLGDGQYIASAMGVWGMALLTVTLVGASLLLGKKMGAIFRV
ncbi:MAG: iron ABC transporter permease [Planctomycetes bacterium]|nr:iron ABC transporter permease [Planctomycetota bacterium]NOG53363.1 iron ABC transporter permease [Planctomycetota bacterium]